MRVSVADAKNKLPELLKAVENGEVVTICRRGVPVADLIPTRRVSKQQPIFGTMRGRIKINDARWWAPMSDQEIDAFLEGHY
jgi:prevent-host-death family protein